MSEPNPIQDRQKGSRALFREYIQERGVVPKPDPERDADLLGKSRQPEKSETATEEVALSSRRQTRNYLRRYLSEFRNQRGRLFLILFMGILGTMLQAVFPWSSKLMIDFVLPRQNLPLLLWTCGFFLLIGLSSMVLQFLREYTIASLLGNFAVKIKRQLMRVFQEMPLEKLQEMKVGGVISSLQSDTEQLAGLMRQGILIPFNSFLMFTIGVFSLFMLAWQMTLICLVFMMFIGTFMYVVFNLMRPFWKSLRRDRADISGNLTEIFNGIEVVRAFSREASVLRDFSVDNHFLWRKGLYGQVISMILNRLIWLSFWTLRVAIWGYGGYRYFHNQMSLGDLMAFMALTQWLFQPIQQLMNSISQIQLSMACAERVFDLLDEPPAIVDPPDAVSVEELKHEIRFDKVVFNYPDGTRALDGIDLVIPKGKVTALVGPSGAGKSSITNLLMRFYDYSEGHIFFDCHEIRQIKLNSYRKLFSLVHQDVILFDGTVRDNIAYGRPEASFEEIVEAAKVANCHDFIMQLEHGYETVVGERGVKLSGGQKQRIALARAVLVDPQVLILDEATSNLDTESEALIQEALRKILRNRTTLVIAHRLSTIMDADQIVVLDHGRILELGNHEELMQKKGKYYQMFTRQMAGPDLGEGILKWEDIPEKKEGRDG